MPTDAAATCTVAAPTFAKWFASGAPSLNGIVSPDSAQFAIQGTTTTPFANCPFYQWAEQTFLWATSPAPASYGGKGLVFSSLAFFIVPPADASGKRILLSQIGNTPPTFQLRSAQVGPHGKPVIFSVAGQMLEVALPSQGQRPLVRAISRQLVQIAHARLGSNGMPMLLDAHGSTIEAQKLDLRHRTKSSLIVTKFTIDNINVFIGPLNQVIDVEQNEAVDNGVLESQAGSLIYYETLVNDVYAYFATARMDGKMPQPSPRFPTTLGDLERVVAFAQEHKVTFPDINALVVELKTSWVEASTVPDVSSYITTTATIPTYKHTSTKKWTQSGQKTVLMALVGMHVVGAVPGHPELIWATFEHFANAPRDSYTYINSSNSVTTRSIDATDPPIGPNGPAAQWLFATNGATSNNPPKKGGFNAMHMRYSTPPPEINGVSGFIVSPSDTIRSKAFGVADVVPNPLENCQGPGGGRISPCTPGCPITTCTSTTDLIASANTEIISINNSVQAQLISGDVRANYLLTGATWTPGGVAPNGFSFGDPSDNGNAVGTSFLSNTTMETYQQGTDSTHEHSSTNCFTCHQGRNAQGIPLLFPNSLSHIYGALRPLFSN
ncbi:MAG TPA: hypothetical protein VMT95_04395 [Candidatus Binatia bacterium]|nr:hypothetical protein [Candidatus Binatia bacterium]